MPSRTAILGAGSWGLALAAWLGRRGMAPRIWGRDRAFLEHLQKGCASDRYLPGFTLPHTVSVATDLQAVLHWAEHLVVAVPSAAVPEIVEHCVSRGTAATHLILATKGFVPNSSKLLPELVQERLATVSCLLLSGPTFAADIAAGKPAAAVLAADNLELASKQAALWQGPDLRLYASADLRGVALAGAIKNVLAIAAGIADGMALGDSSRASLISRGLQEMGRLIAVMGGAAESCSGLAGLGDLVLTCCGALSRNRRLGMALAKGLSPSEALASLGQVAEGWQAAKAIHKLAETERVEMPICEQVCAILHQGRLPQEALQQLLQRELPGA